MRREIAVPILRNENRILDPHSANARVVESGLDGDHITGYEELFGPLADKRRLMDIESDSVACAVEKSFPHVIHPLGGKPSFIEICNDRGMDLVSVLTRPHHGESQLLGFLHRVIDFARARRKRAFAHGSAHIGPISGLA